MLSGRLLAALVFLAPIGLVACASDQDGAPEDVAASSDAISGSVAVGAELVTTSRVNLREGPSTSDDVILTLPNGARVTAVAATPTDGFYQVSYNGEVGWAFGAHLRASGAGADDADDADDTAPATSGPFNGRRFSNVTMLWQGNWSYLVRCDSYSRAKGRVVFFCDDTPSRSFVDDGAWIAVPRANFSRSMCGDSARVCKGDKCIVARIVEKSVTAGRWEGSTAVLKTLGADTGFTSCTRSFGTATGVTVTLQ